MPFHVPNEYRVRAKHDPRYPYAVIRQMLSSDNSYGNNGFFIWPWKGFQIRCQASDMKEWEHVSVTIDRNWCPTWQIMCLVKNRFWDEDDTVMQLHPPKSENIDNHPYCLHLWRPTGQTIPTPPMYMVGLKID